MLISEPVENELKDTLKSTPLGQIVLGIYEEEGVLKEHLLKLCIFINEFESNGRKWK